MGYRSRSGKLSVYAGQALCTFCNSQRREGVYMVMRAVEALSFSLAGKEESW